MATLVMPGTTHLREEIKDGETRYYPLDFVSKSIAANNEVEYFTEKQVEQIARFYKVYSFSAFGMTTDWTEFLKKD